MNSFSAKAWYSKLEPHKRLVIVSRENRLFYSEHTGRGLFDASGAGLDIDILKGNTHLFTLSETPSVIGLFLVDLRK